MHFPSEQMLPGEQRMVAHGSIGLTPTQLPFMHRSPFLQGFQRQLAGGSGSRITQTPLTHCKGRAQSTAAQLAAKMFLTHPPFMQWYPSLHFTWAQLLGSGTHLPFWQIFPRTQRQDLMAGTIAFEGVPVSAEEGVVATELLAGVVAYPAVVVAAKEPARSAKTINNTNFMKIIKYSRRSNT